VIDQTIKLGDVVWQANFASCAEVWLTCPCCNGAKEVTVILGDGRHVHTECKWCQSGFDLPRGVVKVYQPKARTQSLMISGIIKTETPKGEVWSFQSLDDQLNHVIRKAEELFFTEAEALVQAQKEATTYLQRNLAETQPKQEHYKSYAWNAIYHLEAAERAQRDLAHHQAKAHICQERSKKKETQ